MYSEPRQVVLKTTCRKNVEKSLCLHCFVNLRGKAGMADRNIEKSKQKGRVT